MIGVALPEAGYPLPGSSTQFARFVASFRNHRIQGGIIPMAALTSIVLAAAVVSSPAAGFAANIMAVAALFTALASAGGFVKLLWRIRVEARTRDQEHGILLARVESLSERCEDFEQKAFRLESEVEQRDHRIEELEFKLRDQAGQLTTMHSLLNDIGVVLKEDGVTSVRLTTLYQRYELTLKSGPITPPQRRGGAAAISHETSRPEGEDG